MGTFLVKAKAKVQANNATDAAMKVYIEGNDDVEIQSVEVEEVTD